MTVIATAGHVDHGKSTLVKALTGTDPDRWTEEKERGLTIDLGFAQVTTPMGHDLEMVDVPGHIRFLKNMLAGVGSVQASLFVVAATEGWKPQSEEHLRILDLLGIADGIVVLTKADLAGGELTELAKLEIEERVTGTFLAGADIVAVDALSGTGMDQLWSALDALLTRLPGAADLSRARLWVDRAFSIKGAGAVVTGSLHGGQLDEGDEVLLEPGGVPARIRSLQRHGSAVASSGPGHRLAVNLSGPSHHAIDRGSALLHPAQWHTTAMFDGRLDVLRSLEHPVSRRGAYAVYVGSGEHPARLRLIGDDRIDPGSSGTVRIHLPQRLPLLPGDRFIVRETGRGETVGGGEVLDVDPALPASRARPDRSIERVVRERGWIAVDHLRRVTGELREPTIGRWVVDAEVLREAQTSLSERVAKAAPSGIDVAALTERERAVLSSLTGVEIQQGQARPTGTADDLADHPFLVELDRVPFAPPSPDEVDRRQLRRMVERGLVVESDGIYFSASAFDLAAEVLARLLAADGAGVTASAAREALGTSRKYALPLLGALDRAGITRRRGELRVRGPKLPTVDGI